MTRTAVVVGNPKPGSRTLEAALLIAAQLTDRPADVVIDVVTLGVGLLGFGDETVMAAVRSVQACDILVVASPTYKGSYTGVLKTFLDQFPGNGLEGVTAFPLMLGAGPGHAMAPELLLKPVLVELGAIVAVQGLYLLDSRYREPGVAAGWLDKARSRLPAATV